METLRRATIRRRQSRVQLSVVGVLVELDVVTADQPTDRRDLCSVQKGSQNETLRDAARRHGD